MKLVMSACFWVCLVCIAVGAILGIGLVWKFVSGDWMYQAWQTIGIVFLAAALTLAIGQTYLGKDAAS